MGSIWVSHIPTSARAIAKRGLFLALVASGLALHTLAQAKGESAAADNDSRGWEDISAAHGADLEFRGWSKSYVLDTFDHDRNGRLDEEEHRMLVVSLAVKDPQESATALSSDTDAADSHISQPAQNMVTNPQEETNTTLAQKDEAMYAVAIEDLTGTTVTNSQGEPIGEVDQVVVNPRTDTLGLVVRFKTPGSGDSATVVPLDRVEFTPNRQLLWQTDQSAGEVQQMAAYQADDYIPVSPDDFPTLDAARDKLLSTARRK